MAMAGRASAGGSLAEAWRRWWNRAAAALDAVTASFCRLLADVQNKLVEMKANRDVLRRGRHQSRSRAERTLID